MVTANNRDGPCWNAVGTHNNGDFSWSVKVTCSPAISAGWARRRLDAPGAKHKRLSAWSESNFDHRCYIDLENAELVSPSMPDELTSFLYAEIRSNACIKSTKSREASYRRDGKKHAVIMAFNGNDWKSIRQTSRNSINSEVMIIYTLISYNSSCERLYIIYANIMSWLYR